MSAYPLGNDETYALATRRSSGSRPPPRSPPARGDCLLSQIVQVDGLVGAVEPADTQVDDRTCDLPPIIRRHGDAICNGLNRCVVEGLLASRAGCHSALMLGL